MNIRIVSGALGGRVIRPDKAAARGFRPTLERIRQSVADSLEPRIPGARVADICAGCGAFGFELLSRGAARLDCIESNRARGACIEAHARRFGVADAVRVVRADARGFVRRCAPGSYDIVFFDPPYDDEALGGLVVAMLPLLTENGILIHQRQRGGASGAHGCDREGRFQCKSRRFGASAIDVWHVANSTDSQE